ncbi:hypothetical protein MNAN1_001280 [Malassezia nana]|uniref:Cation efflux protein transmembrane domain-containing protein n=1 Tax=Malassezia nana TaxID=180528 RepID=A0AAF0J1Q9_9BASI|nr:hypothetical protein MNAN1_001280 [Malassezia nana]
MVPPARRTPSAPCPPGHQPISARPSALSPERMTTHPFTVPPSMAHVQPEARRATSLRAVPEMGLSSPQHSPTKPTPIISAPAEQDAPTENDVLEDISPTKKRDRRHERRASYMWTNSSGDIDPLLQPSKRLSDAFSPDMTHLISPDPSTKRKVSGQRSTSAAWSTLPSAPSHSLVTDTPPAPVYMQVLPCSTPMLTILAVLDFGLGAVLWVLGQVRDSLALVGFGFLLVFDALGIVHAMIMQRAQRAVANELLRPFGVRRFETLLDFTLVVYLLFAGIYMCKENAEHALLASSAPHEEDRAGLSLPILPLALVWLVCVMTNVLLKNHQRLSMACGMCLDAGDTLDGRPQRSHARHVSVLTRPMLAAGPLYDALTNPFAVMILFFATVLFVSSLLLPPAQAASFDKLLAGLEGTAMMYVSASALRPLSKVLLQAAPPVKDGKASQMHRAVHIIESHPKVVRVTHMQMWQLALPSLGYTKAGIGTDGKRGLAGIMSMHQTTKSAPVVVTMRVEVNKDATSEEILEVGQFAWQQCAPSIGASRQVAVGEPLRGSMMAGDLTIQVTREAMSITAMVTIMSMATSMKATRMVTSS